jgi:outer membrane murein-binding lipoprotein Lpp
MNKPQGGDVNMLGNRFMTLAVFVVAIGLLGACTDDEGQAEQDQKLAQLETEAGQLQIQVQQLKDEGRQAEQAQKLAQLETEAREARRLPIWLKAELEAVNTAAEARATALREQTEEKQGLGERPTIRVLPEIWKFPEKRVRTSGDVWFIGSGLEPNQWFMITVHHEGGLADLPEFAEDKLRQANAEGAFALSLPFVRPGRFFGVPGEWENPGGVWVVKLRDLDTEAVLASTSWLVCGSSRENQWCETAIDSAIPLPVVELIKQAVSTSTIWELDRIRVTDDAYQFRPGEKDVFGYEAGSRVETDVELTIVEGDTITLNRLENTGSKPIRWGNEELGIEVKLEPGARVAPWQVEVKGAGTFVLDDLDNPGQRTKLVIVAKGS